MLPRATEGVNGEMRPALGSVDSTSSVLARMPSLLAGCGRGREYQKGNENYENGVKGNPLRVLTYYF